MSLFTARYAHVFVFLVHTLFAGVQSYVLFAANIEDFHSIAKQFVPAKLADQLKDIASKTDKKMTMRERIPGRTQNEDTGDETDNNDKLKIDFEELVRKVKERIQNDLAVTASGDKKIKTSQETSDYSHAKKPKLTYDHKKTPKRIRTNSIMQQKHDISKIKQKITKEKYAHSNQKRNQEQYIPKQYSPKLEEPKENIGDNSQYETFEAVHLITKNDSYEEYVTPKKDYYEYGEAKTKSSENYKKPVYDDRYIVTEAVATRFIANALTESKKSKVAPGPSTDGAVLKTRGTMIPTREVYQIMSSPNYLAKLPIVAERYDFDEPLPEKDRLPDDFEPIESPPARINKKIKI